MGFFAPHRPEKNLGLALFRCRRRVIERGCENAALRAAFQPVGDSRCHAVVIVHVGLEPAAHEDCGLAAGDVPVRPGLPLGTVHVALLHIGQGRGLPAQLHAIHHHSGGKLLGAGGM